MNYERTVSTIAWSLFAFALGSLAGSVLSGLVKP